MYLAPSVTAGRDGDGRGTGPRRCPPCPVPAARPVPGAALCGSLPTCRARVPRRARPGGQAGPIRAGHGRPGLAEPAYGPPAMPGPAPARTPAKQPPAAPARPYLTAAQMPAGKGKATDAGKRKRPGKTQTVIHPGLPDRTADYQLQFKGGERPAESRPGARSG